MSEQIKKLAEQAGLYHVLDNGNLYPTNFTAEQSITAYNTFAELIVQECARELDERTVFVRGIRAGTWIKQHFEVKECL